ICYTIVEAIRNLPESDQLFLPRLSNLNATCYPTLQATVALNDLHNRIALSQELIRLRNTPANKIQAHPAAATFPGNVADDAQTVTKTITIDLTTPRWHSTGLYARPGEPIHISLPDGFNTRQIKVRIGCHTDTIWQHDKWARMPEISTSTLLKDNNNIAANAFGGLIYIEVPGRIAGGKIDITISNAVQAPYFVLGQTTNQQWQQIRQNPAPWGELATDKVIISVPSDYLRNLNDPEALMHTWDKVLDACAELAGISPNRPSPERIVPDVQISVGYMHSGYPIMTHSDQYEILVNKDKLLAGQWGLYHELGHNHQNPDWTFAGTGEVTVNLFTLYVYDKVCSIPPLVCDRSNKKFIADNFAAFVKHNKDFSYWQDEPFVALGMYMQLQHEFGWQPFRNVFTQYLALPQNQRPRTDQQKMDQWLIRFSREIGHNLSPFFDTWNIPVSTQAKESLKDLPDWTVTT
ncbi:MAG: M60 family metallopeptidase, partial [Sedimentisphaerales bacterium]|nr:M60 family metallopeptidase [Sedimentisphaerales bacterium]